MALYPGATFKPTTWGGKTKRNRQGRGILHVAVSARTSYPPFSGNTWHFYVAKAAPNGSTDGSGGRAYCEQYVDTEYRAYGDVDANDDAIVVETAGGLGTSRELNAEKLTPAQELRIADLMRWESQQPGGAPLQLLPDAKAGRTGWGPHRLGIKHSAGLVPGWWFPGCEVWSTALGKECPGDAKVAQLPQIIARAQQLLGGAPTQEDTVTMEDVVHSWYDPRFRENRNYAQVIHNIEDQATAAATQLAGLTAAVSTLAQAVAGGRDDLTAEELTAAVDEGIRRGGAAVLAAQEAARAAHPDA